MHEWALAESVLEAVSQAARKRGEAGETERLVSATILFGELQQIDEAIFTEGLRSLSADYGISADLFAIEHEPAGFRCNVCGTSWTLREIGGLSEDELEAIHFLPETAQLFMNCPGCGDNDFAVETGRGISISEIRTETMTGRQ